MWNDSVLAERKTYQLLNLKSGKTLFSVPRATSIVVDTKVTASHGFEHDKVIQSHSSLLV
jgi:hypothetical protein